MQTDNRDTEYELAVDLSKEKGDEPFLERNQWLKDQFSRRPYRIYNYWIAFTIMVLIPIVCYLPIQMQSIVQNPFDPTGNVFFRDDIVMFLSSAFLLLGCGQMLYGMKRTKPMVTQRGFLNFEYSVIIAIVAHLYTMTIYGNEFLLLPFAYTFIDWLIFVLATVLPITHIISGFFVIRVFKKNHPLERKEVLDGTDQISKEMYEQYEVIAEEVWKYDKQLKTWPFTIYKWWLKIVLAYEIARLDFHSLLLLMSINPDLEWDSVRLEVSLLFMFILSVFAALKIQSAMKTKSLRDSKMSIIVFVICIFEALAVCIFTDKDDAFLMVDTDHKKDGRSEIVLYLMWVAYCLGIPVVGLFGAYKGSQILKERDHYVRASNLSDDNDTYL